MRLFQKIPLESEPAREFEIPQLAPTHPKKDFLMVFFVNSVSFSDISFFFCSERLKLISLLISVSSRK